ncbi:MAG: hypothetical protein KDA27_17990 [Candidatus Eisenbacteria bacterium]|uniref:Uncharacterized protein n=1 Tax=Eiseniibacteriota bacterium TaxID=2212470 RepID=A0A956NE60_UNCEI|nr:hypothetical protein [Candidatus Eisenbacteria bacterium]
MRTPSLTTSPNRILMIYSVFHLVLLRAARIVQLNPEILAKFEAAHNAFAALITARDEAQLVLVESTAYWTRGRRQVERGIRDFAYAVLGVVQEDRSAPRYRAYFPDGYGYVSKVPTSELIKAGDKILAQLAQVPEEQLASAGADLSVVLEEAKGVQARYEEARDHFDAAKNAVEVGKRPWREAYRASYYALQILHADDPRQAEDYFRQVSSKNRSEDDGLDAMSSVDQRANGSADSSVNGAAGSSVNGTAGSDSGSQNETLSVS